MLCVGCKFESDICCVQLEVQVAEYPTDVDSWQSLHLNVFFDNQTSTVKESTVICRECSY